MRRLRNIFYIIDTPDGNSRFFRTKKHADRHMQKCPVGSIMGQFVWRRGKRFLWNEWEIVDGTNKKP